MDIVLNVVLPVFGVLVLGYAAARAGLFDEAANRGLSVFVFNFAIPLLLFRAIAQAALPEQMPWGFLLSYYIGAFAAFGGGMLAGRLLYGRRLDEQGVLGLNAAYSNTVLLGIPLVITAYGQAAALPLFVLIASHSLLMFPSATAIIEAGRGRHEGAKRAFAGVVKGLATNPIILGLLTGLAFSLFGWTIPAPVEALAKSIGAAASPCALFALGASLTRYRIVGNLGEPLALVFMKMALHPLLVWLLAAFVFALPPLWTAVAVTLAALPTGINVYVYAQRYQLCVQTVTTAILISTAISIASLSGLLFLFKAP